MDKRCDFCCDPDVTPIAYYDCPNFIAGLVLLTGGWYACRKCDELIQASKFDDLRRYVLERYVFIHQPEDSYRLLLDSQLKATYAEFAKHKGDRKAANMIKFPAEAL